LSTGRCLRTSYIPEYCTLQFPSFSMHELRGRWRQAPATAIHRDCSSFLGRCPIHRMAPKLGQCGASDCIYEWCGASALTLERVSIHRRSAEHWPLIFARDENEKKTRNVRAPFSSWTCPRELNLLPCETKENYVQVHRHDMGRTLLWALLASSRSQL